MSQGIGTVIDVCQTYEGMSELTRSTLYLAAMGQKECDRIPDYERTDILWFLRAVLQLLELEQDTVRMEIEELRTKLERESEL